MQMGLREAAAPQVPESTARVAWAVFPQGNGYMLLRDEFGPVFADAQFRTLFPAQGRPALAPGRLALVTVLQFAEGLSDRQAAEAVRRCIDWKYLLGLELEDPGFDASVLSDFRGRLLAGSAELLLFETVLTRFRERGLLKARGRQRTDGTHVLAAVRFLNRLEGVGETVRQALNALATVAPEWLQSWVPPAWFTRYGRPFAELRLPRSAAEREAWALLTGADGAALLAAVCGPTAPGWLREVPAVEFLRQMWVQQYYWEAAGPAGELLLRWREDPDRPPAPHRLISPYDPDARYGKKRETTWVGYKVHLTETCDPDQPHLITDVQTTPPLEVDSAVLPVIQAALATRGLRPAQLLADSGYVSAGALAASAAGGVDLMGPAPPDTTWQARAGQGFAAGAFTVHWEERRVDCPAGQRSSTWSAGVERGKPILQVYFARETCAACMLRPQCTQSPGGRRLTLRPQAEHQALQQARQREQQPGFWQEYGTRAGIEGTQSQAVRRCGLRRSRYLGRAKTHLQHLATAAALNLVRMADWLLAKSPARTRRSAFSRLAPASM
jgi:transposase